MLITYCGPFDAVEDQGLGLTIERGEQVDVDEAQALARLAQRGNFEAADADSAKIVADLDAADGIRDALAADPFDLEVVVRTLDGFTKAQLEAYVAGVELILVGDPLKADVIEHLVLWAAASRGIDLSVALDEPDANDDTQEG